MTINIRTSELLELIDPRFSGRSSSGRSRSADPRTASSSLAAGSAWLT
jgi:hypothetical protein